MDAYEIGMAMHQVYVGLSDILESLENIDAEDLNNFINFLNNALAKMEDRDKEEEMIDLAECEEYIQIVADEAQDMLGLMEDMKELGGKEIHIEDAKERLDEAYNIFDSLKYKLDKLYEQITGEEHKDENSTMH